MCGIVGIFSNTLDRAVRENYAREMAEKIAHRGRDSAGFWSDKNLTLAHRRLAIIDLSSAGDQPMHDCEWTLVYNGEIYNHADLRRQLSRDWRGHSDTEILLAAFADWGVEKTLASIRGMFAGALWNAKTLTLTFFRDSFGEKPLYYGVDSARHALVFASEIRAFQAADFSPTIAAVNHRALAQLITSGVCRDCIWENFRQLPPASFLEIHLTDNFDFASALTAKPIAYWSPRQASLSAKKSRFSGSLTEATDQLETRLREVVREQLFTDVPVGVLLSGGVDSALVAALTSAESGKIKTFTVGFADRDFDEAPSAKRIAEKLSCEHYEIYIDDRAAREIVEKLPEIYDEPFADSSQIPTFAVCREARKHVAVALTGDGGDEIFGGYQRYWLGNNFWRYWRMLPKFLRRTLTGAGKISPRFGNWLGDKFPSPYPRRWGDKFQRLARAAGAENFAEFYRRTLMTGDARVLNETFANLDFIVSNDEKFTNELLGLVELDFFSQAKLLDQENYLPTDLLVKIDRAAMANTLETRAPLLDWRLAEWAWSLPPEYQMRGTLGKIALREVLFRYLPKDFFHSQKKGFGVPIARWLRGALRDWGENLLAENSFSAEFFNPKIVRKLWDDHQKGIADNSATLWHTLVFQQWRTRNISAI